MPIMLLLIVSGVNPAGQSTCAWLPYETCVPNGSLKMHSGHGLNFLMKLSMSQLTGDPHLGSAVTPAGFAKQRIRAQGKSDSWISPLKLGMKLPGSTDCCADALPYTPKASAAVTNSFTKRRILDP